MGNVRKLKNREQCGPETLLEMFLGFQYFSNDAANLGLAAELYAVEHNSYVCTLYN